MAWNWRPTWSSPTPSRWSTTPWGTGGPIGHVSLTCSIPFRYFFRNLVFRWPICVFQSKLMSFWFFVCFSSWGVQDGLVCVEDLHYQWVDWGQGAKAREFEGNGHACYVHFVVWKVYSLWLFAYLRRCVSLFSCWSSYFFWMIVWTVGDIYFVLTFLRGEYAEAIEKLEGVQELTNSYLGVRGKFFFYK